MTPIFIKLTIAHYLLMGIFCAEFHPDLSRNTERAGRNSYAP